MTSSSPGKKIPFGLTQQSFALYKEYLQSFARLSGLFSDSDRAYIPYRFVENLYAECVGNNCTNLARKDNSFDAKVNNVGIGIKTFVSAGNTLAKQEKVAEFTIQAKQFDLASYRQEALAYKVAELRNMRILSDCGEENIDISKSVYHCLMRFPQYAIVFDSEYPLIDVNKIEPVDRAGNKISKFPDDKNDVHFSVAGTRYKYSRAKNVLYKEFVCDDSVWEKIPLIIDPHPFSLLRSLSFKQITSTKSAPKNIEHRDFVVLPLYSSRDCKVPEKSGINQWNAGGRPREFGEAYIPVPRIIWNKKPDFFPLINPSEGVVRGNGKSFKLHLPNGSTVSASICQDNLKALMSNPNKVLVEWLYSAIDGSMEQAQRRKNPCGNQPYTMKDLISVGKDSVVVFNNPDGSYDIHAMTLNSWEVFEKHLIAGDELEFDDLVREVSLKAFET